MRTLLFLALAVPVALGCGDDGSSTPDDMDAGGGGGDAGTDPPVDSAVECESATDCPDPDSPICARGSCSPCLTDTQCLEETGLAYCLDEGGCADCRSDADCGMDAPFCSEGDCVACRSHDDCFGEAPYCAEGSCVSCTDTTECDTNQRLEELMAILCADLVDVEGDSALADAFQPLFCSARGDVFPFIGVVQAGVEAGRMTVTVEALEACRAAEADEFEACFDALAPQVDPGGSCYMDEECAGGWCDLTSCAGTCVALAGVGETCERSSHCADDMLCSGGSCTARPGDGESCSTACAEGFFCNGSDVCEAIHGEGGSCGSDSHCMDPLYCAGSTCTAPPAEGESCLAEWRTPRCGDGLRCVAGTCESPSTVGDACSATTECPRGARCVDDVCRQISLPGEACDDESPCAVGTTCLDGRCASAPDVGEACFAGGTCLRGVCNGETCEAQAAFSTCPEGVYAFDALDPCGAEASCTDTPSGWQCAPESAPGASCGGSASLDCRSPDTFCNDVDVCEAVCLPAT